MKKILVALSVLLFVASTPAVAQVPWSLILTDPIQCGPPGTTLTFHGVVENYVQRDLEGFWSASFLLNSEGGQGLPLSYASFGWASELIAWMTPGFDLPALGYYEGPLFRISWTAVAPDGFWQNGQLQGYFAQTLITRDWQASVCGAPPVPEPASLVLLGGGLIGVLLLRRRR